MKKQYKSSIIKNHKITKSKIFYHVPLKGYIASEVIFRFGARNKLEALERLYRSTGLIFLQWQKKFLTIIIQSLHFSSLKKKGMEKTCEKRRKKW